MHIKKNTDFTGEAVGVTHFSSSNVNKKSASKLKKMITGLFVLCGIGLCGFFAYHAIGKIENHKSNSGLINISNADAHNGSYIVTESVNSDVSSNGKEITNFNDVIANISASSQHEDEVSGDVTYNYSPENMVDNDLQTCWCEGIADGNGVWESITIQFNDTYSISEISIWNGLCKSEELFYKNSRISQATIEFSDGTYMAVNFSSDFKSRNKVLNLESPVVTSYITIRIDSVYEGEEYADTCITEISAQ